MLSRLAPAFPVSQSRTILAGVHLNLNLTGFGMRLRDSTSNSPFTCAQFHFLSRQFIDQRASCGLQHPSILRTRYLTADSDRRSCHLRTVLLDQIADLFETNAIFLR